MRCGERRGGLSPSKAGKVVSGEGTQGNGDCGGSIRTTGTQTVLGEEQAVADWVSGPLSPSEPPEGRRSVYKAQDFLFSRKFLNLLGQRGC